MKYSGIHNIVNKEVSRTCRAEGIMTWNGTNWVMRPIDSPTSTYYEKELVSEDKPDKIDQLLDFLLYLNESKLIDNHTFDYLSVVKKYLKSKTK